MLFGLKNCDSCRKARKLITQQGLDHTFHDVRSDGLAPEALDRWITALGWEALLNRRGTTWRALPEAERADLSEAHVRRLLLAHPALIKRPVLEVGQNLSVGLGQAFEALLATADRPH